MVYSIQKIHKVDVNDINNSLTIIENSLNNISSFAKPFNSLDRELKLIYSNKKITNDGIPFVKDNKIWLNTISEGIFLLGVDSNIINEIGFIFYDKTEKIYSSTQYIKDFKCEIRVIGRKVILNILLNSVTDNFFTTNTSYTPFFTKIINLYGDDRDTLSFYTTGDTHNKINVLSPATLLDKTDIYILSIK